MANFEGLKAEAMDNFRKEMAGSFQVACNTLNSHLQHAEADIAALIRQASRVDELELEAKRLKSELAQKNAESEAQRATIVTLQNAHAKLDAKARQMKSWINHVQKGLPELSGPASLEQHSSEADIPKQKEIGASRYEDATSETTSPPTNLVANDSTSVHSTATDQDLEDTRRNTLPETSNNMNDSCIRIDSDPATASTESAPSEPSQSLPGSTKPVHESDSDLPQVVFERTLKRKRSKKAPYIKPEPRSPIRSSQTTQAFSATLDLDDVSLPLGNDATPKTTSGHVPSIKRRRVPPSAGSTAIFPAINNSVTVEEPLNIYEDPEDKILEESGDNTIGTGPPQARFISSFRQQSALQPKTPNPRVGTLTDSIRSTLRKRGMLHADEWTEVFGEDRSEGEEESVMEENVTHPSLEDLLMTKHEPGRESPVPQQKIQTPSNNPKSRLLARSAKSARARSLMTPAATNQKLMPATEPRVGLRARGIESLRLEDFKLNPARNQGEDFAFGEVVRHRNQRKCLPGCTKPDCCGSVFSRAVQIGGYSTPSRPGLGDTLRGNESSEDDRLLRNYLGDAADRLEFMSSVEREDLLLKAKVAAFGQHHGKHRHLHARPPSPVGFWRTDMPSTQEMVRDKEKAQEREHEKVRERWQEAMRPNGLWMFRDECPPST